MEANTGQPVTESLGDCAYVSGETRQEFAGAGRSLIARVPQERPVVSRSVCKSGEGLPAPILVDATNHSIEEAVTATLVRKRSHRARLAA